MTQPILRFNPGDILTTDTTKSVFADDAGHNYWVAIGNTNTYRYFAMYAKNGKIVHTKYWTNRRFDDEYTDTVLEDTGARFDEKH